MKKFNELVSGINFNVDLNENKAFQQQDLDHSNARVAKLVNLLFKELMDVCPMASLKWNGDGLDRAKKLWVKTFIQEEIFTISQIKYGIIQCRRLARDFPPNVGLFIKMCIPSPQDLKIPDVQSAYFEACRNREILNEEPKWSHKAVYHAAKKTNFSSSVYVDSYRNFEKNYIDICKKMSQGVELDEIPRQLTDQIYIKPSKESWEKNMRILKNIVS